MFYMESRQLGDRYKSKSNDFKAVKGFIRMGF